MKKVLLLALGLALVAGTAGADFIRYHPPQFTYNGSGFVAPGIVLAPNGTTTAPSYAFTNAVKIGIYYSGGTTLRFQTEAGGSFNFQVGDPGTGILSISSTAINTGTADAASVGTSALPYTTAYLTRSVQGSKSKTLTDAAVAVPVIRVPIASNSYQAGDVIWNAQSTDATDYRTTVGTIHFAGISKGAAPTCTVNVVGTDLTASSNANTLACTWTNVVNATNCDLSVTCTDNTAGSQTMTINFRADIPTMAVLAYP